MIITTAKSIARRSARYAIYPWVAYFLLPILIWMIFGYSEVVHMVTKMLWWGFVSGPVGYLLGEPLFHQPYVEKYWIPVNVLTYLVIGIFWYAIFFLATYLLISLVTLNDAFIKWREKS